MTTLGKGWVDMLCTQCGHSFNDDSKFCPQCGKPVAAPTELQMDLLQAERETAAAVEAISVAVPAEAAPTIDVLGAAKASRSFWSAHWLKLLIGAMAAVFAVGGFFAYSLLANKGGEKKEVVYIKDNSLNIKKVDMKASVEITGRIMDGSSDSPIGGFGFYLNTNVKFNSDHSKLFFLDGIDEEDGAASLYYKDLTGNLEKKADEKGVKIASNVIEFNITDNGDYAVYVKKIEDERKLYINDFNEETLIEKSVNLYYLSDDGKQLMYSINDEESGSETVYVRPLAKDGKKVKVDSQIDRIVNFSANFEKVYFMKSGKTEERNARTLYVKEANKDKQQLISKIDTLEASSLDGIFYFTRHEAPDVNEYDLVDDDLLSSDKQLKEPVMPVEPSYTDYQIQSPREDYWTGQTYYVTETDYDAYNAAYDNYRAAYDEYGAKYDEYNAKRGRDELRNALKAATVEDRKLSLYKFEAGKEQLVTDSHGNTRFVAPEDGIIIYSKIEKSQQGKIALSTISSVVEVQDFYNNSFPSDSKLYAVVRAAKESTFADEKNVLGTIELSYDRKKLYLIEKKDNENENAGELRSYDVTADGLQNKTPVDQDVASFSLVGEKLYYYKDATKGAGELYVSAGGQKKKLASDVWMGRTQFVDDGRTIFYFTDFDTKNEAGSLYRYANEKAEKIADDVFDYTYTAPDLLYYLSDYSTKNMYGDLWEYQSAEKKKMIDDHVSAILGSARGNYDDFGYE